MKRCPALVGRYRRGESSTGANAYVCAAAVVDGMVTAYVRVGRGVFDVRRLPLGCFDSFRVAELHPRDPASKWPLVPLPVDALEHLASHLNELVAAAA